MKIQKRYIDGLNIRKFCFVNKVIISYFDKNRYHTKCPIERGTGMAPWKSVSYTLCRSVDEDIENSDF